VIQNSTSKGNPHPPSNSGACAHQSGQRRGVPRLGRHGPETRVFDSSNRENPASRFRYGFPQKFRIRSASGKPQRLLDCSGESWSRTWPERAGFLREVLRLALETRYSHGRRTK
jgi:hypothetical protein